MFLNPDHTHFLMVDDGQRYDKAEASIAQIRAELEWNIYDKCLNDTLYRINILPFNSSNNGGLLVGRRRFDEFESGLREYKMWYAGARLRGYGPVGRSSRDGNEYYKPNV